MAEPSCEGRSATSTRSRLKAAILAVALVAMTVGGIAATAIPAQAAVSCTSFVHDFHKANGKLYASAGAYCSQTVSAMHVTIRIFDTHYSPADPIASNSQLCGPGATCPLQSNKWVNASGSPNSGCHPYEARASGWFTPHGEPPAVHFDMYPNVTGTINAGRGC
jgi:hypothetical protein